MKWHKARTRRSQHGHTQATERMQLTVPVRLSQDRCGFRSKISGSHSRSYSLQSCWILIFLWKIWLMKTIFSQSS